MNKLFMQPRIRVGLCENSSFGLSPVGPYEIQAAEDSINYTPLSPESRMTVKGMTIGHNFHWQQQRDLIFKGSFIFRRTDSGSTLINVIPAEDYIESVISSEMSASAPLEYLKAHAIISRSWLMRILLKQKHSCNEATPIEGERISYTQNDRHTDFDVCADDHCQRYQGVSEINMSATEAVKLTRGQVLSDSAGNIADCRFSKCCGGHTELFSTAWDDITLPYLASFQDPHCTPAIHTPQELTALRHCLKDYDSFTEYFRWEESVSKELIQDNLNKYLKTDIGDIITMSPVATGPSGRIFKLRITGTRDSIVVGKELTIRKLLSTTHLKSSAFEITSANDAFRLRGKGWGHGVGLCQIGAAIMAIRGATAEQILQFYYPNTSISILYE